MPQGMAGAALAGAVLTTGAALLLGEGPAGLVALAGYAVLLAILRVRVPRFYPHPRFGACNTITLWRAAVVLALLAALVAGRAAGPMVAALAAASLTMDGMDGWLARRAGLVSDFGGRFDMEVDAATGLVLSLHALAGGIAGPAVLLLGLPRYAFLLGAALWPWLGASLPQRLRRKTVCVIQLGALILLQLPGLPRPDLVVWAAAFLLVWSFAIDIRWLWKRRG